MKILFQGGWKAGRDPEFNKKLVSSYCESLAEQIVRNNHTIVLTSNREFDKIIADKVSVIAQAANKNIKNHLLFLLPDRIKDIPTKGVVKRFESTRWWIEERTYCVQQSDALIAVGGGKGTFDCVEKTFLSGKPVFVAAAIPCPASKAWNRRKQHYQYITKGDADFVDDLNITPDDFFNEVFRIINKLAEIRYSRRIFIVHGRDHYFKDTLVNLLNVLEFEAVVLQDEPSKSLTIIEKLERDTEKIGFSFVLYTPDDLGHLPNDNEKFRARQNVIFEHGLLIGLLGRERTCAIIKGDLEIPSDIHGMIYENIDDLKKESLKIAKILKDAGYRVDSSKLL
jgi:predicted nucleotide-binding protein